MKPVKIQFASFFDLAKFLSRLITEPGIRAEIVATSDGYIICAVHGTDETHCSRVIDHCDMSLNWEIIR